MGWISGKPAFTLRAFRPDNATAGGPAILGGNGASWRGDMRKLAVFAVLPAAMLLAGTTWTTAALADDPILTKAPAPTAPAAGPGPCDSVPAFFLSSCQLAWYGVKVYGVVDFGGGYQTNGAPFNPQFPQGSSYLVQKMNRELMWTLAPNAMQRSSIGVQVNEPFAPGWRFRRSARSRVRSVFAAVLERAGFYCRKPGRAAQRAERE